MMQVTSVNLVSAFFLLAAPWTSLGFVTDTGPNVARLAITPDSPKLVFHWDGSFPEIEEMQKLIPTAVGLTPQEKMVALLDFSMNAWNEIPGSFLELAYDINPNIEIDPEDRVFAIKVLKSKNVSEAASAVPVAEGKVMVDCDVSVQDKSVEAKSLARTLIHELGHCLGLGHNHSNYGALMGYSRMDTSVKLGADDVAGVIYLYPDPTYESPPKEVVSCGTIGAKASHPETSLLVLLLFFLPIICVQRRRERQEGP